MFLEFKQYCRNPSINFNEINEIRHDIEKVEDLFEFITFKRISNPETLIEGGNRINNYINGIKCEFKNIIVDENICETLMTLKDEITTLKKVLNAPDDWKEFIKYISSDNYVDDLQAFNKHNLIGDVFLENTILKHLKFYQSDVFKLMDTVDNERIKLFKKRVEQRYKEVKEISDYYCYLLDSALFDNEFKDSFQIQVFGRNFFFLSKKISDVINEINKSFALNSTFNHCAELQIEVIMNSFPRCINKTESLEELSTASSNLDKDIIPKIIYDFMINTILERVLMIINNSNRKIATLLNDCRNFLFVIEHNGLLRLMNDIKQHLDKKWFDLSLFNEPALAYPLFKSICINHYEHLFKDRLRGLRVGSLMFSDELLINQNCIISSDEQKLFMNELRNVFLSNLVLYKEKHNAKVIISDSLFNYFGAVVLKLNETIGPKNVILNGEELKKIQRSNVKNHN